MVAALLVIWLCVFLVVERRTTSIYLQQWEDSVAKRAGFIPKQKGMMVLTNETHLGIRATG